MCQNVDCGGACCKDYQCEFLTPDDCTTSGGTFQGLGVACDPDFCGGVGPAPGWSTFQHDAQRTGRSTATVSDSPVLLWSLFTGASSSPITPTVSPDGTILVADNRVVAVNSDGTLKWQAPLLQSAMASPAIRLDGNFWLSNQSTFQKTLATDGTVSCGFPNIGRFAPALAPDGSVYVTDGTDTGSPWSLYKVNADCSIAWTYHGVNGVASHIALGNDGGVYVNARFGLIKLDPSDGTEDWVFQTPGHTAAPAIAPDGTIYLSYEPNFVLAVNPDGTQKWVHPFDDPDTRIASSYQSPIVDENNTLYMPAVRFFQRGALVAIDADGVEQWMIDTPYSGTAYSPAMDNEGVIVWTSTGFGGVTTESGECADGIDNDCDDLVDCTDPNCRFDTPCRCENGFCGPLETPCTCIECGMQTSSEVGLCSDGIDNDCDGTRDCLDDDCASDSACSCGNSTCDQNENSCTCAIDCGSSSTDEAGNCNDDVDNDCDGDIDCFDSDCASDGACLCGDQVCTFPENPCNCVVDCGSILVGLSSASGSEQWRVPLTPGDHLNSSPAIGGDGTVYATTNNGYLLAFGTGCAQPPAQNPPYTYRKAIQENDIINGHQIVHIQHFELLPDGRVVVYAQVGGSTTGAFTELVGGGFESIFPGDTIASHVVSNVEMPRYADDGTRYLGALLIGAGEVILVDDAIFVAETSSGISVPVLVESLDWHYVNFNQLGKLLIREQLVNSVYRLVEVDRFTADTNTLFTDGQLVEGVPFSANTPDIDGYGDDGVPLLCCVATPSEIVVQNGDTFAGHPISPPVHPRRNAERSIYFLEAGEGAVYQLTPDGTQRVRRSPGDVIAGQPILWVDQYAIDDDNNVAIAAKTLGSRGVFFEDYSVAVENVTQIDGVSLSEVRTEYPGVSTNDSHQVAFLAARTNEHKAIWVATPDSSTYDTDRDCIFDAVDNCPLNANPGQADGDDDGIGDSCDTCPIDNPNDPDNDGICSSNDNCPSDPNPLQPDSNGNGVGDACEPVGCLCNTSLDCRNNAGAATLCADDNGCNCAECQAGVCIFTCTKYGNVTCDGGQLVDLDDILCVLGGFANYASCPNADLSPCGGNGIVNLDDILSVLDAFSGSNPCDCNLGDAPPFCGSIQP